MSATSAIPRSSGCWRPDATVTLDFALSRLTGVVDKLLIYPERMKANLESLGGLVFSQRVLLALTQAGISREAAYTLVQRNAMQVWHEGGSFLDRLAADPEVTIPRETLAHAFSYDFYTKHVDDIFARVFAEA